MYNTECHVVEEQNGSSSSSSFTVDDSALMTKFSNTTSSSTRPSATNNSNNRKNPLVKALVAALQKDHMLDVTLVGKKGVNVRASRYVLSCRCEALEDKLYSKATCTKTRNEGEEEYEVYIGDYSEVAIKALVEYCFTGELLEFYKSHASSPLGSSVDYILELSRLANDYHFSPLKMEVHQLSRRLMNQHPSTACLFFSNTRCPVDTKTYAQQTLQECPQEALLASTNNHVASLPPSRLETLFDEDLLQDLEEMDKAKLLQLWSEGSGNDVQVARRISTLYIDLTRIPLDDEENLSSLKSSNLFDEDVLSQLQSGASTSEPQRLVDEEHVVVRGAGLDAVNTVFIRDYSEQDMFLTECDTYTLYCWNGMWHIAASCDLSNSLYQCLTDESFGGVTIQEQVPSHGWQCVGAPDPAPECTWIAARGSESTLITEDEGPTAWSSSRELSADYAMME